MPKGPQCDRAVDRRHERCVYLCHAVVIEAEDYATEARVMRDIFGLYAVDDEFPLRAILRPELGRTVHRVARRPLVPRCEAERAGDRRDVIRVRPVFYL